jgi:hypothetical protein
MTGAVGGWPIQSRSVRLSGVGRRLATYAFPRAHRYARDFTDGEDQHEEQEPFGQSSAASQPHLIAKWRLSRARSSYLGHPPHPPMKILALDLCSTRLTNPPRRYNDLNKPCFHIVDEARDEPLFR